jgi:hypothetical protein
MAPGGFEKSISQASKSPLGGARTTARAFFVADRLNTSGLERSDVLATTPLAFRVNENGVAILFRYGVAVLIGLNALEEDEFLRSLQSRMTGTPVRREEETATIELASEREDQIPPGGPIYLQSLSPERLILVGEALAKSVVLARHEREVAAVFDIADWRRAGANKAPCRRAIHSANALSVRLGCRGRSKCRKARYPLGQAAARAAVCAAGGRI